MQRTCHLRQTTRLAVALAGAALVTGACGSEPAISTGIVEPATTTTGEPPVDVDETRASAETVALADPAPTTTAITNATTTPTAPEPEEPPVEPAAVPEAAPPSTVPPTTVPPGTVPPVASDDLVLLEPEPPLFDDIYYEDEPGPCTLPAIPADAVVGEELWFDLGGGHGGHRVVSYASDGTWKLRVEFSDGAASELEIQGAGVHGVRPVGFADVDLTFGGEELLAVVGGGAASVEIGVFAFLEGGCIHRYRSELGGDFGAVVGGTIGSGGGLSCGDGHLVVWGYQLEADDTYTLWSTAYEPVALPVFGYVPASDGHAQGLTWEDVTAQPLFECADLTL